MQIISRQESVKKILRNMTLHEWMCFEAEDTVIHNWTDVAVHDRKILNKMRQGDTRLWIISELGSCFLPLYCKMYEKQKQEEDEYEFSAVEVYFARFIEGNRLASRQNSIFRKTAKFYFITKGSGEYDYSVVPVSFLDAVDFVFCGQGSSFID